MKLRLTVLGTVLSLLLAVASAEALILDAPHNRDNGIYCYHCHSADPATGEHHWFTADDDSVFDPVDFTRYNWVCNRCHTPEGTRTIDLVNPDNKKFAGPTKKLHSASSTDTSLGTWSTECIDCHDPHFQAQIEWYDTEIDNIYVELGTFGEDIFPGHYDSGATIYGHTGATRFKVKVPSPNIPTDDWAKKGKAAGFENRGEDNSRGLILVVDRNSPNASRTFEIVDMEDDFGTCADCYFMTVKGDMSFGTTVQFPDEFGVLYGGSLKKQVTTPAGEVRDVKFFTPNKVPDAPGGPVDLTVGETAPVGLCQVCHQSTVYFLTDTEEANHHDADLKECTECHDILEGGSPETPHTSFITANIGCADCHIGYDTAPDTAHIDAMVDVGCQTCHTAQAPYLNASVEQRVPYTSDGSTHAAVPCIQCHNNTYGGVDYQTGHPTIAQNDDKDLAHTDALVAQSFCVSACHGTLGVASTGIEIVENTDAPGGHSNGCGFCHITVTPPVELTAGALAAASPATASQCNVCHDTYFTAHDHGVMDTIDNGGAEHVITNHVDCSGCHNSTATDAPDAINAPYVGADEVHFNSGSGCALCHSAANGAPIGSATNWNGSAWGSSADTNNNCVSCHGAYFNSHGHTHDVSFSSSVDKTGPNGTGVACFNCHDDAALGKATLALGTWASILTEHETVNQAPVVPGCPTCHSYNSDAENTPVEATVNSVIADNSNVTCKTCHVPKNTDSHGSHLPEEFAWNGTTLASCGDGGGRNNGSCHNQINDGLDVVLNVHGQKLTYADDGDPCNLCHVDVVTNQYARISGPDGDADTVAAQTNGRDSTCDNCHTASTASIHHNNDGTVPYTPATTCATGRCHNSSLGKPADHTAGTALPDGGMVINRGDTGEELSCIICHDQIMGDMGDGNNIMLNSDNDAIGDKVHDTCTTCHEINGSNLVVLIASSTSSLVGDMPDGGTAAEGDDIGGTDGGGTCTACHTGYFEAHTHHDSAKNNFKYNFTLGDELNPKTGAPLDYYDPIKGTPYYLDMSWDINREVDVPPITPIPGPVGCGQPGVTSCHTDLTADATSLNTWEGIKLEHDRIGTPASNTDKDGQQGCYTCHYNDSRDNGINNAKYAALDTIGNVVAKGTKNAGLVDFVNCTDCHFDKKADNVHGLLTVNHLRQNTTFQGTLLYPPITANPECLDCHYWTDTVAGNVATTDTDDIVIGIHKNTCGMCHVSQPNLLTAAGKNFANLALTIDTFLCTDCHSDAFTGLTEKYHGMDPNHVQMGVRHNNLGDSGGAGDGDCLACHTEISNIDQDLRANEKLVRHMPNFVDFDDDPSECFLTCHGAADVPLGDTSAAATITAGSGAGTNQVCENCHVDAGGDAYLLHGLTNATMATPHGNLAADDVDVAGDTNCDKCHTTLIDPAARLAVHADCVLCHSQTVGTAPAVINAGMGVTPANCRDCHVVGAANNYKMHFLTNATTVHDKLLGSTGTGASDCEQCHAAGTTETRLGLHANCATCHSEATSPATTQINLGVNGTGINCEGCHGNGVTTYYTMHKMTEGDVATADLHLNINTDGACTGCHTMTSQLAKLQLHSATADCLVCHKYTASTPLGVAATAISNGTSAIAGGSNQLQNCVTCHSAIDAVGVDGAYGMHGVANNDTVHDKLLGSTGTGATDCEECHIATDTETRLDLHANCATCHSEATSPATDQITLGLGGTGVNCEGCHGNGVTTYYTMHKMTEGDVATADLHLNINTDATCTGCHTMTSQLEKLQLHSATADCLVCHKYTASTPLGVAATAINNGTSAIAGGSNQLQNCITCHAGVGAVGDDGKYGMHGMTDNLVASAHDHLAAPTNANSSCDAADCHAGVSTLDAFETRITTHTTGSGPTSCVGCHTGVNSSDSGVAIKALIADGVNLNTDVTCEACHATAANLKNVGGDWYEHADPDHSSGGLGLVLASTEASINREKCMVCHDEVNIIDAGSPNWGVHNMAGDVTANYSCILCHDADSTLAVGSSAAGKTGGGECVVCHTGGFDSHSTRAASHNTSLDESAYADPWTEGEGDRSQADAQFCNSSGCHDDASRGAGLGLLDWPAVIIEHETVGGTGSQNACIVCHDSARSDATTINPTYGTTVQQVIANYNDTDDIDCLDCHWDKRAPNGHGGHDKTVDFLWTGAADGSTLTKLSCGGGTTGGILPCHNWEGAGDDVIGVVHDGEFAAGNGVEAGQTTTCENCHNDGAPGGVLVPTGGAGNTGVGKNGFGTSEIPPAAVGGAPHGDTCTTCHTGGTFFDGHSHDHSLATGTASVTGPVSPAEITNDCLTSGCHTGGTSPYVGGEDHTGCDSCHTAATGELTSGTNGDATVNSGNGGQCVTCHAAWFDGHTTHTATVHTFRMDETNDVSGGSFCNAATCHGPGGTGNPVFENTWDGAVGIWQLHNDNVTPDNNGCASCHDSTRGNGDGTVDESRHGANATIQDVIQSATPADTRCLDCHFDRQAAHGGHESTQFSWGPGVSGTNYDTNVNTCGTGVNITCHNPDTPLVGDAGVADSGIHLYGPIATEFGGDGFRCMVCHLTNAGGDLNMRLYDAPSGDLANVIDAVGTNASHSDTVCTTCHKADIFDKPAQHHNSTRAQDGLCEDCHGDPRAIPGIDNPIIKQKACRGCHIKVVTGLPGESIVTVQAISLGVEANGADGTLATSNTFIDVRTDVFSPKLGRNFTSNHEWTGSNATGIENAIDNYGACLFCHGKVGQTMYPNAVKVAPYHALPLPGAFHLTNNTMAGDGWHSNLTGGPGTGTEANFRGATNWWATATAAYWPIGKGRMNIGYAQHSLVKGGANEDYAHNNTGAQETYMTFMDSGTSPMNFGKQVVEHLAGTPNRYVPHYDTTAIYEANNTTQNAGAGIDTVTIGAVAEIAVQGFSVTATSTAGVGTILHFIWGGVDLGTFLHGETFEVVWSLETKANNAILDDYFCFDQFNAGAASQYAIVSELGGAAVGSADSLVLRGTSSTEDVGLGLTCAHVLSPP